MTQPDRPAGRGQRLAATPVKTAALALGLTVRTPVDLRAFARDVQAQAPACCVVASYGRIVPQALLDAAPVWFNVHPSLLPLYRGATPIQSAIRDGSRSTAVSIIAMDAGMDTGDLLVQTEPIPIGEQETYGELHDRLAPLGAALLAAVLDDLARGALVRTPQAVRAADLAIDDDTIARTRTQPWTRADTVLPLGASARAVVDRVRALAPRPGAVLPPLDACDGAAQLPPLKILRAHAVAAPPAAARPNGAVIVERGYLYLRANDGWVAVDDVVPAGRAAMSMAAYANGRRIDATYAAVPA